MAKDETKRLKPGVIQADKDIVRALDGIPGYAPNDPTVAKAVMQAQVTDMENKQGVEVIKKNEADAARDAAVASEWALHNLALRVKEKVIGQFGSDSNEAAAVGLKKKSERKSPTRKPDAAPKK